MSCSAAAVFSGGGSKGGPNIRPTLRGKRKSEIVSPAPPSTPISKETAEKSSRLENSVFHCGLDCSELHLSREHLSERKRAGGKRKGSEVLLTVYLYKFKRNHEISIHGKLSQQQTEYSKKIGGDNRSILS